MAYQLISLLRPELYETRSGLCPSGPPETFVEYEVRREQRSSRDPESRVKPFPLTLTARARQYTEVATLGQSMFRKTYSWGCEASGYNEVPVTVSTYRYLMPSQPIFGVIPNGWVTKMRNAIQDDKVSFAESIGEWRDSVALLQQGASTLKRASQQAKRLLTKRITRRRLRAAFMRTIGRNPNGRVELYDFVAADLALKFGIAPNIAMLHDVVTGFSANLSLGKRLTVTDKITRSFSIDGDYGGSYTGTCTSSVRAIAFVRYNAADRTFTTGNLGESLWAGTPFSFMVDWFLDVGSYLSSFNAMQGVKSITGALCIRHVINGVDQRNAYKKHVSIRPGVYKYKSQERQLFTELPYASFPHVRLPSTALWSRLWTTIELLITVRR